MNIDSLEYKHETFYKSNKYAVYPLSDEGINHYTKDSYIQRYLRSNELSRINENKTNNKNSNVHNQEIHKDILSNSNQVEKVTNTLSNEIEQIDTSQNYCFDKNFKDSNLAVVNENKRSLAEISMYYKI